MPYSSIKSLPVYVRKYSDKVQRQWMHVFNSVYERTSGSEERAFKAANSVLKKRFKSKDSLSKNSRHDIFQMQVDDYLGNLKG